MAAQFIERDILADLNAALDLYAHLAQDLNFRGNNILFQLIGWDTVHQHAARALVLFKHSGSVALFRQIIRAAQASRTCADDRDLFCEQAAVRGLNHRRDIAGSGVQILLGDEFFHLVDGDCLVDGTAGTGVLTAAVAYAAAHSGEWVFLLNQGKGVTVAPLGRHFQIALHGNMRRAGGFARRRAGIVAVDAVVIPVILVPLFRAPFHRVGKLLLRIRDGPVLRA